MKPTVLLFDIDGTLVTTGGAGHRAMHRAFETLHQRTDACDFRFDGMTDRAIARQGLLNIGAPSDEAGIDALLAAYLEALTDEVSRVEAARYRLHPGMEAAVNAACARENFAVGLGTGNLREGARIKLSRLGIYERFAFGGFGCDHEDRTELIRVGAQRGADRLGAPLAECRVVVVGDTPKDVLAAKGIGAECLGVGTGSYTPEVLRAHGAEGAFADLAAPGALEWLLGGGRAAPV
jgi:phosphoglycolate phosphatase-like HAD superfamily hydrolase